MNVKNRKLKFSQNLFKNKSLLWNILKNEELIERVQPLIQNTLHIFNFSFDIIILLQSSFNK
jgi:hypothetical protein